MTAKQWTFKELAKADAATLEKILRTGPAPDWEQMNGYIYNGWNLTPPARLLSGEKFKKGFLKKSDGKVWGYNEYVEQDKRGLNGQWNTMLKNGRPNHMGFYRISYVQDEPPQKFFRPYEHLGYFNYNLPENKGIYLFFRTIRDFIVLPNRDDHSLILCKAYVHIAPGLNFFYCYFMLGHREPIAFAPWETPASRKSHGKRYHLQAA